MGFSAAGQGVDLKGQGIPEDNPWVTPPVRPKAHIHTPDIIENESGDERDESEEAQEPKGISWQCKPCKEAVERHMLNHLPFRAWCEFCVKGRAVEDPHRKKPARDELTPGSAVISMDYCWAKEEVTRRKEGRDQKKDDDNPIVVWKCRPTKANGAHTVSYTHLTLPTKRIV